MTLAALIRRRQQFLTLSASWDEAALNRLFGLLPGTLDADGLLDMAAKDAEAIADAVVPLFGIAVKALQHVAFFAGEESTKEYARKTLLAIRVVNFAAEMKKASTTTEYDDDRR